MKGSIEKLSERARLQTTAQYLGNAQIKTLAVHPKAQEML